MDNSAHTTPPGDGRATVIPLPTGRPAPSPLLTEIEIARRLAMDSASPVRAVRALVRKVGAPYRRVGGRMRFTETDFQSLLELLRCSPCANAKAANWYGRGTIRVGDKQTAVKEHSTGLGERPAAQAYKTQLEKRIQEELLFGTQKKAADVTFAEVGTLYITRPEGLRSYDVWRIGELNEVLGDTALNDIKAGWLQFRQQRCQGLSPATVERFRAVLQAALNHYGRAHDLSVPRSPRSRSGTSG